MKIKQKCTFASLLLFAAVSAGAQNINVKGSITAEKNGETIIGASIREKGATGGAISDINGNFQLGNVKPGTILVISYVGYKPVEVKAAPNMTIRLEENDKVLNELVVTGYTTQRKADLTGAVSVVNMDDLQKEGENNPMKALQGKVPGMYVTANGNPSGAATVRIRGIGTMNNNDPLYIITVR